MKKTSVGLLAGLVAPGAAWACACGCGVFDVGTSSLMPERAGGTVFLNYDYQNQNQNWSGTSSEQPVAWKQYFQFWPSGKICFSLT